MAGRPLRPISPAAPAYASPTAAAGIAPLLLFRYRFMDRSLPTSPVGFTVRFRACVVKSSKSLPISKPRLSPTLSADFSTRQLPDPRSFSAILPPYSWVADLSIVDFAAALQVARLRGYTRDSSAVSSRTSFASRVRRYECGASVGGSFRSVPIFPIGIFFSAVFSCTRARCLVFLLPVFLPLCAPRLTVGSQCSV